MTDKEWEYRKTKGTVAIVALIALAIISFLDL